MQFGFDNRKQKYQLLSISGDVTASKRMTYNDLAPSVADRRRVSSCGIFQNVRVKVEENSKKYKLK